MPENQRQETAVTLNPGDVQELEFLGIQGDEVLLEAQVRVAAPALFRRSESADASRMTRSSIGRRRASLGTVEIVILDPRRRVVVRSSRVGAAHLSIFRCRTTGNFLLFINGKNLTRAATIRLALERRVVQRAQEADVK
jgi:hypothetical protein